jgi:serine/threonine-protein kinase
MALDYLKKHQIHAIISDQRMPTMLGVDLLRQAHEISPRSIRILLTGYSDLAAIVGSINEGEIYRFISKPWDNKALQTIVAEAVTIGLELVDTKAVIAELPANMSAGILVIEKNEDIFRVTRELVGGLCPVVSVSDTDAALRIMNTQEIAVVIADIVPGQERLITMLELLKQERPQILTIVTVKMVDSELIIDLINQALIFRILNKPINVGMLKSHIHAALQRYLTFRQTPKLLQEQTVLSFGQVRQDTEKHEMLNKIKSLPGRGFGA